MKTQYVEMQKSFPINTEHRWVSVVLWCTSGHIVDKVHRTSRSELKPGLLECLPSFQLQSFPNLNKLDTERVLLASSLPSKIPDISITFCFGAAQSEFGTSHENVPEHSPPPNLEQLSQKLGFFLLLQGTNVWEFEKQTKFEAKTTHEIFLNVGGGRANPITHLKLRNGISWKIVARGYKLGFEDLKSTEVYFQNYHKFYKVK